MQDSLFGNDNSPITIIQKDGVVIYYPNFFKSDLSINYYDDLKNHINWSQDQITLYGKTHNVPRLQAWYAQNNLNYSYSGIKLTPNPFIKILEEIRTSVEIAIGEQFNSCLCNYYRDGSDYAAWHSDDEEELGRNPVIASASFGEERKIVFKHKTNKGLEKVEINLEDKSLLVMSGSLQHHWKHQLNKTSKSIGGRVNLTFRKIISKS